MNEGNATVEFVEKIQRMTQDADKVELIEIGGHKYHRADRALSRIKDFEPKMVELKTLSGLAEIIRDERKKYGEHLYVIVQDDICVYAVTTLLGDLDRDTPYMAEACPPSIKFGQPLCIEDFLISLRSQFVYTEDIEYLSNLLMSVTSTEGMTLNDDGITQNVVARKGVSLKDQVNTKPIVKLQPYRTFAEVEQPESEFLFRISDRGGELCAALYEADGGAWKNAARENIKQYLKKQLGGIPSVKVIA